ncbi:MBL fold metallo-hydrolase [Streptomyces fodineus]|uniref:MBL fold metallo-hydrolase n=1 Tax=Streptomyces fodineus TaxID=1904616 RepID=A0A1D7YBD2_9ACTN|nr:MBL fold metallo-hydrolase [Streptomyces fodineus]AOR32937.1 MBL fold metallo-hydrolase [Streptomyces fodineus]
MAAPDRPRVQEVGAGVHAYVQPDGGWCLNNAGVVAVEGECAVVDTAATMDRAYALRDAVRRLTPAAPRLLVNTHFHGDHTFGNAVFAPDAVVVGHEHTRPAMTAAGLHLTTLWPDVRWGEISLHPPTVCYRERMTLHLGATPMELIHPGPAHSTDDTAVWLPEQRVLFTGDLVMSGVTPFIPMGSLAGSLAAIAVLRGLGAETVVPGHGPVGGPELLDGTERYLRWLRELARTARAAGLSPLEAAREADLGEFAGLLDSERLVPNLHRAYAEEEGAAPGAPLDIGALFAEMVDHHGGLPVCRA